ncbi:hypothetical protein LZ31DRAFT_321844 [Colletotrichum somersetense]|nr:hypothetical protein LZ31DRAFT_321844 [Colletotrichum somersetense]
MRATNDLPTTLIQNALHPPAPRLSNSCRSPARSSSTSHGPRAVFHHSCLLIPAPSKASSSLSRHPSLTLNGPRLSTRPAKKKKNRTKGNDTDAARHARHRRLITHIIPTIVRERRLTSPDPQTEFDSHSGTPFAYGHALPCRHYVVDSRQYRRPIPCMTGPREAPYLSLSLSLSHTWTYTHARALLHSASATYISTDLCATGFSHLDAISLSLSHHLGCCQHPPSSIPSNCSATGQQTHTRTHTTCSLALTPPTPPAQRKIARK